MSLGLLQKRKIRKIQKIQEILGGVPGKYSQIKQYERENPLIGEIEGGDGADKMALMTIDAAIRYLIQGEKVLDQKGFRDISMGVKTLSEANKLFQNEKFIDLGKLYCTEWCNRLSGRRKDKNLTCQDIQSVNKSVKLYKEYFKNLGVSEKKVEQVVEKAMEKTRT